MLNLQAIEYLEQPSDDKQPSGEGGWRYASINRPIAGPTHEAELPVGKHPLQLYSRATPNGVKVTITRLDPIHVVFAVPQARWADVREALQARPDTPVTLLESAPLAPQGARQPLQGKVLTRDNQIDPASGTLKLKAAFANGDDRLLPGQAVSVRLPVRQLAGALVLPATAVQAGLRWEWNEALEKVAIRWALGRGNRNGRCAYQFARYWVGLKLLEHKA